MATANPLHPLNRAAETSELLTPVRSVGPVTRRLSHQLRQRSAAVPAAESPSVNYLSQRVPSPVLAQDLEDQMKEHPNLFMLVSDAISCRRLTLTDM